MDPNLLIFGQLAVERSDPGQDIGPEAQVHAQAIGDTQDVIRTIPLPDVSSFSPAAGGTVTSKTPVFSWDAVDYPETTLYYRLEIRHPSGDRVFATRRTEEMLSYTIPEGILTPGETYERRVRVTDSSHWVEVQNRSHSDWVPFTMADTLSHSSVPAIDLVGWGAMTWTTTNGTNIYIWIDIIDHDGISDDGSSHSVTIEFPGGATYPLQFYSSVSPTVASFEVFVNLEGNPPESGPYTFRVTDPDGNVGTVVDTLVADPLDPPDQTSFTSSTLQYRPQAMGQR